MKIIKQIALIIIVAFGTVAHGDVIITGGVFPVEWESWNPDETSVIIGIHTDGRLVNSGESLSSWDVTISPDDAPTGSLKMDDGASWTIGGAVWVDKYGDSSTSVALEVLNSSTINSGGGNIATFDAVGEVTISNSTWTMAANCFGPSGDLTIAGHGSIGILNIVAGSVVSCTSSQVGWGVPATGTVIVDGRNSKFIVDTGGVSYPWGSTLRIGLYYPQLNDNVLAGGLGIVNISNGGLVRASGVGIWVDKNGDPVSLEWREPNDSHISMSGNAQLAIWGDATQPLEDEHPLSSFLDLIIGNDDLRYWNYDTANWANITSAEVSDYTLEYKTEGELEGYTVLTVINPFSSKGDTNNDYKIDIEDYNNLVSQFGSHFDDDFLVDADFNDDQIIDLADFIILRQNFGNGGNSPTINTIAIVPDPITLMLLILGSPILLNRKRHRLGIRNG